MTRSQLSQRCYEHTVRNVPSHVNEITSTMWRCMAKSGHITVEKHGIDHDESRSQQCKIFRINVEINTVAGFLNAPPRSHGIRWGNQINVIIHFVQIYLRIICTKFHENLLKIDGDTAWLYPNWQYWQTVWHFLHFDSLDLFVILVHPFPPMVPHLSPSKKSVIFELHQNGTSNRKIAQRFNCHHTTISRIIVNMEKSGTPYYVTPGRGRKSILDEQILCLIERELFSGHARDIVEAQKNLDLSCDASTIHKALNKFGLHGRVCRKKPLLKPIHVRKQKLGLSSLQNGCIICGALYGSLTSQSTIFLARMGRNIAGEGLGKNFCPGTLPQQWRGVVAKSMCGA